MIYNPLHLEINIDTLQNCYIQKEFPFPNHYFWYLFVAFLPFFPNPFTRKDVLQ